MKTIRKYTAPTNVSSFEPYGTVWIAEKDNGSKVWVQTSEDETKPQWVRAGDIVENYFIRGEVPAEWASQWSTLIHIYNKKE